MIISIIVCTYNRADILKATLPSILTLEIPCFIQLELIIVDNNSNDNTAFLTKTFIRINSTKIKMKYIFERTQGLSYARNAGYKEASGEYIVYTDDECILPEQWIVEAVKIINESSPAFLGGPYYGKYLPNSSSSWFKESYGDSYILQYNLPNGPMSKRYLSGGNLFIRQDVFQKIGNFNVSLGMSGEAVDYGEEIEFQKRLIRNYPDEVIWYEKKIYVYHFIRNEKMRIMFLFKDALIRGISEEKLKEARQKNLNKAPLHLLFFVLRAVTSMLYKVFQSLVKQENYYSLLYVDYINGVWSDIGRAWYKVKYLISRA